MSTGMGLRGGIVVLGNLIVMVVALLGTDEEVGVNSRPAGPYLPWGVPWVRVRTA